MWMNRHDTTVEKLDDAAQQKLPYLAQSQANIISSRIELLAESEDVNSMALMTLIIQQLQHYSGVSSV